MNHLSISMFLFSSVFKVTAFWHLVKVCQQGQNVYIHRGPTVRMWHSWIEHLLMRTQPEDMFVASLLFFLSSAFIMWCKMKPCSQNSRNTVLISCNLINFNACCSNRWGNLFENSWCCCIWHWYWILLWCIFFINSLFLAWPLNIH